MFDQLLKDPGALSQVLGAIIGVIGLIVGTIISIVATLLVRRLDMKHESKQQIAASEGERRQRELLLKQEIYSNFISELASIENFIINPSKDIKDFEKFTQEWTRIEIKVDLICSQTVMNLKETLQAELFRLAKQKIDQKKDKMALSEAYLKDRTSLLEAIRVDMDIKQNQQ